MPIFKKIILILLIQFIPIGIYSQHLLPPIYNYQVFEYNAAGQNWGLAVNEQGELFSANDQGLLSFNGEEWVLNKLPNRTIIRSVHVKEERIYTGSYEEFGFWKKDSLGLLEYTSLTHLIKSHTFTNEEFWQILEYKNQIVFRSFSTIYIYHEDKITVINPEQVITNIAVFEDELIVATKSKGLYTLEDEKLKPLLQPEILLNATIISLNPFDDGLLIGTQLRGCYLLKNDSLQNFHTPINSLLKKDQLNKIEILSGNQIAFGTIKNGIYLYNSLTKKIRNLNRGTGLQNNTVLSLYNYKDQLWAGLENGIDRIRINSPIKYYTDYSGLLGTTHDLLQNGDTLYLGSNTGIYYLGSDNISFIEGSQGHVWDLEALENDLMAGHNTATFKINSNQIQAVSDISGGYAFAKAPETMGTYIQGTYTGLAKYQKTGFKWQVNEIDGIDFPVRQLCFEDKSTLWVAHPYKGLFRFKLDESLTSVIEREEFLPPTIPSNYQVKLYQIKNQIILQSDGKWFKYDPIVNEISLLQEFEDFYDKDLIYADGDIFWFVNRNPQKELIYTDLKDKRITIANIQLNERLVPDMERIVKQNDSIYLLTLSDGFAEINLSDLANQTEYQYVTAPKLAYLKDNTDRYSNLDSIFKIPYNRANNVEIQVTDPYQINPSYFFELSGAITSQQFSEEGTLNFQNLPHGDYILKAYTVGIDNKRSYPMVLYFTIAPPWYLSTWSMALYFLLLVVIVLAVRWYNRQKLKRRQNALTLKMQREQDERLAQLEREKLEKEIKGKQNELARTTMSVAKKNELILELKELMLVNKDAFLNKQRYRSLTKKLDSSINEDEDWKQFEVNFKELHNDFFENLLREFPKLTPKDLKLCAYLKMNLSTKEIAPLMAISVRGVEIHRYRLRKKLGIDSTQNLTNFLIKYK